MKKMASGGDIDPPNEGLANFKDVYKKHLFGGLNKAGIKDMMRANEITSAKKPFIGYKTNIPKVGETKPEIEKRSINLNPDYAADDELRQIYSRMQPAEMRKGGKVKKMASGGKVSSASKRADGCAVKGKTRGRMV
jgi:hypothetical protein